MFVQMDVIGLFDKALRRSGFRDNGPIMGSQGRLHANGKKKVATIKPLRMPPGLSRDIAHTGGHVDPAVIGGHLDHFWDSLLREMERIAAEGNVPCDLVFQGGGNIPFPPELREKLEALGFNIVFLGLGVGEEINRTADRGTISMGEYFNRLREEGIEMFLRDELDRYNRKR